MIGFFFKFVTNFRQVRIHMLICSDTSTLAHGWWGMTYGFDVYVFMFWLTLDELLVEHISMRIKKNFKKKVT
jgi:hypothetical protein